MSNKQKAGATLCLIEWPHEIQQEIEASYIDTPPVPLVFRGERRELNILDVLSMALAAWYSDDLSKEVVEFLWDHHCEQEEAFDYYLTETESLVRWVLHIAEEYFNVLPARQYYPVVVVCDRLMVCYYG